MSPFVEGGDGGFRGGWADAVGGEGDGPAKDVSAERVGHGAQAHGGDGLALRAVEVAADHDPRAGVGEFADGGAEALDAGEVGDAAVRGRGR